MHFTSFSFQRNLLKVMSSPSVSTKVLLSTFNINLLRSGCIGYVAGLIVTFMLFCQLLYSFIKMFKSNSPKEPHVYKFKTPYILVMIYLTSSFIKCGIDTILRTNILTSHHRNFTYSRCLYGWIFGTIFTTFNSTMLSIIYLNRIYVIFKDSAFAYRPCIYTSLFALIVVIPFMLFILIILLHLTTPLTFTLLYDPISNLAFCASDVEMGKSIIFVLCTAAWQVISPFILIILLIMFIRGLLALNKQMMSHYMKDYDINSIELPPISSSPEVNHSVVDSTSVTAETQLATPTPTQDDVQTPVPVQRVSLHKIMSSWSRQSSMDRNKARHEIERIIKLHNLIKKQTILVCTSVVSTMVLSVIQTPWDIIINAFCVWMMLDTSKTCWRICKKYGLCWCCYIKTNRMGM